jgi:hypothetical protein
LVIEQLKWKSRVSGTLLEWGKQITYMEQAGPATEE